MAQTDADVHRLLIFLYQPGNAVRTPAFCLETLAHKSSNLAANSGEMIIKTKQHVIKMLVVYPGLTLLHYPTASQYIQVAFFFAYTVFTLSQKYRVKKLLVVICQYG